MSNPFKTMGTLGFGNDQWLLGIGTGLSGAMYQPTNEQILKNAVNQEDIDEFNRLVMQDQNQNVQVPIIEEEKIEEIHESQMNMFNEEYKQQDDENTPLLPPPQGMGNPNNQINEQINIVQNQPIDDVPQEEQEEYRNWRDRIISLVRDTPPEHIYENLKILYNIGEKGYLIYLLWKEYDLLARHQDKEEEQRTPADNFKFMEETKNKVLPKQCYRKYFVDSSGILRSIVICESFGGQRIYKNQ